jgi:hypothetical protein
MMRFFTPGEKYTMLSALNCGVGGSLIKKKTDYKYTQNVKRNESEKARI